MTKARDLANIISGGFTEADVPTLSATKIHDGSVSNTEFGYIGTLTSDAQTQLNTKASTGKSIAMAIVFGG